MANGDPKKTDKGDPPPGDKVDKGDPPAGDDKGGGGADEETVEETVRRVLAEVLPDLLGGAGDGAGGDGSDPDPGGGGAAGDPPRAANVEQVAERAVRAAMDRIHKEEKDAGRLERIEKKLTEEAPRTYRRITRALWGSDEKAKV